MYVYAVGRAGARPPAARGLGGERVEAVREGDLVGFVGRRVRPVEADPDALWRHNQVVEQLIDGGSVLPVRFGTAIDGEAALRALLVARHDELLAALEHVAGRTELGTRAIWRDEAPAPTNGGEFMRAKLERLEAARAAVADLHLPLAEVAADAAVRVAPHPHAAFTAAYLVERDDVAALARSASRLRFARPDVELVCTGPWPPYSFSSDG